MQKYVYVNTCAFCSQAWFSAEVTTHLLFWSYVSSLEFKEIAASLRSKDQNTEAMQTLDLFQNQVSPGKKKNQLPLSIILLGFFRDPGMFISWIIITPIAQVE